MERRGGEGEGEGEEERGRERGMERGEGVGDGASWGGGGPADMHRPMVPVPQQTSKMSSSLSTDAQSRTIL